MYDNLNWSFYKNQNIFMIKKIAQNLKWQKIYLIW